MKQQLLHNIVDSGSRIVWIDNIRLFAILCVIFGHCWYLGDPNALAGYEVAGYYLQKMFIVSFNMPLFVFLSGYCAYKGMAIISTFDTLISYWKKISMRIAIPTFLLYMVVGVVGRIEKQYYVFSLCLLGVIIAVIVSYHLYRNSSCQLYKKLFPILSLFILFVTAFRTSFWFPTMLLQVMLLTSFFFYLKNNNWTVWSVLFAVITFVSLFLFNSNLPYSEEFIIYFVLGFIFKHLGVFLNNKSIPTLITIASFILGCVLMVLVGDNDFYTLRFSNMMSQGSGVQYYFLRQACAICWIVCFCLLFKAFVNSGKYPIITNLGGATLPLYLIHAVLKTYTFPFIHISSKNDIVIWAQIIGVFIALFSVSTLLIMLFRKNEITRVLFLGEKA